jgi:hypothetical protein
MLIHYSTARAQSDHALATAVCQEKSRFTQFNRSGGINETEAPPMSCTRGDILAELVSIGQPISSKSIADRLGKPSYTVSALLSKLYLYGEIGRVALPDYRKGRAYLYYAKGRPAVIAGCIVGTCLGVGAGPSGAGSTPGRS